MLHEKLKTSKYYNYGAPSDTSVLCLLRLNSMAVTTLRPKDKVKFLRGMNEATDNTWLREEEVLELLRVEASHYVNR